LASFADCCNRSISEGVSVSEADGVFGFCRGKGFFDAEWCFDFMAYVSFFGVL
jgi:hypothetical protein